MTVVSFPDMSDNPTNDPNEHEPQPDALSDVVQADPDQAQADPDQPERPPTLEQQKEQARQQVQRDDDDAPA